MATIAKPDLATTYAVLCDFLKQKPQLTTSVVNHIVAKHGIHSLPAFHTSDAVPTADKLVTYGEIVRALASGKLEQLRGSLANGQATAPVAGPGSERTESKLNETLSAAARAPAPDPLEEKRRAAAAALRTTLAPFIGKAQLAAVRDGMRGDDAVFFIDKMLELAALIEKMPQTYESSEGGQRSGSPALAHLHYFVGSCDWYILEKDKGTRDDKKNGTPPQSQAYGWVNLGDRTSAEYGYISLPEILENGAELDFHWDPKPMQTIIDGPPDPASAEPEDPRAGVAGNIAEDEDRTHPDGAPRATPPARSVGPARAAIEDRTARFAKVDSALKAVGLDLNVYSRIGQQIHTINARVSALASAAGQQAAYNLLVNVPTGVLTPEAATVDHALRSALAGFCGRMCNHTPAAAMALCADIMEQVNAHDEAALLRRFAAEL